MGETSFKPAMPFLEKLMVHTEPATIYIDGIFYEKAINQWAEEAIKKII